MKGFFTILMLYVAGTAIGQGSTTVDPKKGELSFGVRSTGSLFSASGNNFGIGAGWQVRYRLSERLTTEWFADWITTDIDGIGQRNDAHIGLSAMIYPFDNVGAVNTFTPYIMGGFCGDYTKIGSNVYFDDVENVYTENTKDRWSFATQLGLGTHYNFSEKFDVSFSTQYVLHFGADLSSGSEMNSIGEEYLRIYQDSGDGLEGHLLMTISANFVVFSPSNKKG